MKAAIFLFITVLLMGCAEQDLQIESDIKDPLENLIAPGNQSNESDIPEHLVEETPELPEFPEEDEVPPVPPSPPDPVPDGSENEAQDEDIEEEEAEEEEAEFLQYYCCRRTSTIDEPEVMYSIKNQYQTCEVADQYKDSITMEVVDMEDCYENMICCETHSHPIAQERKTFHNWKPTPEHCVCNMPGCMTGGSVVSSDYCDRYD